MKAIVVAKYVTAGAGILVFGAGMRTGSESMRWTGIAIVAIAWCLRFVKDREATRSSESDSEDAAN